MKRKALLAAATAAAALSAGAAAAEQVKIGIAAEPYPPFASLDSSGNWVGWEVEVIGAVSCRFARRVQRKPKEDEAPHMLDRPFRKRERRHSSAERMSACKNLEIPRSLVCGRNRGTHRLLADCI